MKLFVATSSFGKDDAFAFDLLRDSELVVARNTLGRTLGREDIDAARVRGMVVVSTPYGPTQAVVELTLGLMLLLIRNIDASSREIKRGEWTKKWDGFSAS